MKALLCTNQGNLGISEIIKQIINNIHAGSLDDHLDHNIKIFFNVIPSALTKLMKGIVDRFDLDLDIDLWSRPSHITNLFKRNKGALAKLLNYELDIEYDGYNDLEFVLAAVLGPIINTPMNILLDTSASPESYTPQVGTIKMIIQNQKSIRYSNLNGSTPILLTISEHLFKGITLTAEEKKIVFEPMKDF